MNKMLRGRVLVKGNEIPRYETAIFGSDDFLPNAIFVTDELRLADYEKVVHSAAVICENGGKTGHVASICRVLGIPVILLDDATQQIYSGEQISFNSSNGLIATGTNTKAVKIQPPLTKNSSHLEVVERFQPYFQVVIVSPENIVEINATHSDKVERFFIREEFIWVKQNQSPFAYLAEYGVEATAEFLAKTIQTYAAPLHSNQMLNFRSLDIRSDELQHFPGENSVIEGNPELGLHGTRKLLATPEYLIAEILAIKKVHEAGIKNIVFSLPFINDISELQKVKQFVAAHCPYHINLGIFVETPAAAFELPYMLDEHIFSVDIGTKDLIQFTLAADRSNKNVAHIYNSRHRGVMATIQSVVDICHAKNVPCYVFTLVDDLSHYLKGIRGLSRISSCAGEYRQLFSYGGSS